MADERAVGDSGDPPPRGRVTPLGWALIGSCPLLVVILVIAKRGPVADGAFLALALVLLVLAGAVLAPPRRPRRPRGPWG